MVVRFRAQKQNWSWVNLTKSVFQSSLGLFLLNWGLAEECIFFSRFPKRRHFWFFLLYEKSTQVVVRFRAQKILSSHFHESFLFNLVFDLFHWTENWWRSAFLLVGCQQEELKDSELKKVSWDNLTKMVFQSSFGHFLLSWGPAEECFYPSRFWQKRNDWFGCSTKKVLWWLSDFELKYFL